MGIYYVNSKTCNCRGSWSTLNNDTRIYMTKTCDKHSLKEGNTIYYKLIYLFNLIKKKQILINQIDYHVKILKVVKVKKGLLLKVLVNDDSNLIDKFDINKQIYYSDMDDEPMWKKIDDNNFEFIFLYKEVHHTVENDWG